jgi:hypothetical protein
LMKKDHPAGRENERPEHMLFGAARLLVRS